MDIDSWDVCPIYNHIQHICWDWFTPSNHQPTNTLPTNLFIWPHLFLLVKVTCIAISGVLTKVVSPDLHQAGGPPSWQSTTASSSAPFNVTLPVGLLLFTWRSARKAALLSWWNIGVATTSKKKDSMENTHTHTPRIRKGIHDTYRLKKWLINDILSCDIDICILQYKIYKKLYCVYFILSHSFLHSIAPFSETGATLLAPEANRIAHELSQCGSPCWDGYKTSWLQWSNDSTFDKSNEVSAITYLLSTFGGVNLHDGI